MTIVRRTLQLAVSIYWVALAFAPASALSLRPATFVELRASSNCVVMASVRSLTSEPTEIPHCHGVLTRMNLGDVQTFYGSAQKESLDVLLPGGELNGVRVRVPGAPAFLSGERVILFLDKTGSDAYSIVGHGMGVQRVSADGSRVTPDIPVEGGPYPGGEAISNFIRRLDGTAAHSDSSDSFCLYAFAAIALLLLCLVYLSRKQFRRSIAVLVLAATMFAWFAGAESSATTAAPREFVLEGVQWNLRKYLPQRVEGGRVQWMRGRGPYAFAADDAFAVIEQMFTQWENIPDSEIAFRQAGRSSESGEALNDENLVSFLASPPRPVFDKFTLAITFSISRPDETDLRDVDIVFNDRDIVWTLNDGPMSIAAVSLHEIGHFLGLDHTRDPATVMYPISHGLTILSQGDIDGAVAIYPQIFAAPVAAIEASPTLGAAPLNVFFDSSKSNPLDAQTAVYTWEFGDGSASNELNPQHTYSVAGTYLASLTVQTPGLGESTDSVTITVLPESAALNVTKFEYQALLYSPLSSGKSSDRLDLVAGPLDLSSGDKLTLFIEKLKITAMDPNAYDFTRLPIILDPKLAFAGTASTGGKLKVRYNVKSRLLSFSIKSARFGKDLDPRAVNDSSLLGNTTCPISLLIDRADGNRAILINDVPISFAVNFGKIPTGIIEKSVRARKP